MRLPTIHLNGTSKGELTNKISDALEHVRAAISAVAEVGPNGRDYYTQGSDGLREATEGHRAMLTKLSDVREELELLWEGIEDGGWKRA